MYHEEGRAVPDGIGGYDYEYAIRDHLGSTRVMFEMVGGVATIIQESHTYPFGMELAGPAFVGGGNPYRYTGKEWEEDLEIGLYDFGARWYDPAAGRWWGVDAMAEKYFSWSPYNYVMGNPMRFVDPDGRLAIDYFNKNGQKIGTDGNDNDERKFLVSGKEAKNVEKVDKKGGITELNTLSSAKELPSIAALKESQNVFSRRLVGSGREESSLVLKDGTILRGERGPQPKVENGILQTRATLPSLPQGVGYEAVEVAIHLHSPDKIELGGGAFYPSATTPSNPDDINTFRSYEKNIIVGAFGEINQSSQPTPSDAAQMRGIGIVLFSRSGQEVFRLSMNAVSKIIESE